MEEKVGSSVKQQADPSKGVQPKVDPVAPKKKLLNEIPGGKSNMKQTSLMIVAAVFVVALGVGTGWFLSGASATSSGSSGVAPGAKMSATEAGIDDESVFGDTAEGKLLVGSIEGEGTHYLDRDAGESKYVFLTSTVIDLEQFVEKKVQVWGETIAAKDAPWLMDVGKIKVVQ